MSIPIKRRQLYKPDGRLRTRLVSIEQLVRDHRWEEMVVHSV